MPLEVITEKECMAVVAGYDVAFPSKEGCIFYDYTSPHYKQVRDAAINNRPFINEGEAGTIQDVRVGAQGTLFRIPYATYVEAGTPLHMRVRISSTLTILLDE